MIMLSSGESGIALVIMKRLLRRISHRDWVPPSRMKSRILASTGRSDFRVAWFKMINLWLWGCQPLSSWRVPERRWGSSSVGCAGELLLILKLFLRTPWTRCDTITFLYVLQVSVCWELLPRSRRFSWESSFCCLGDTRRCGHRIACSGIMVWVKMDDCFWETFSDRFAASALGAC